MDDQQPVRTTRWRTVMHIHYWALLMSPFVVIAGTMLYVSQTDTTINEFMIITTVAMVIIAALMAIARAIDERYLGGTL